MQIWGIGATVLMDAGTLEPTEAVGPERVGGPGGVGAC
jgi:hypothetical protein